MDKNRLKKLIIDVMKNILSMGVPGGIENGMFADWFIRGGGYLYRFKSGKWLEKKIV